MKNNKTLLEHILLAFIPFTEENSTLIYHPTKFMNQVDKIVARKIPRNTIASAISRAKKKNYLKEVELEHNKKSLRLTPLGRIKILKFMKDEKTSVKWDGKWRLIFFDIPEEKKKKRNTFRSKLKELGFKQHQLSAWISPHDFTEEIYLLIKELDIEKYVQYLIGESITNEQDLKRLFGLK